MFITVIYSRLKIFIKIYSHLKIVIEPFIDPWITVNEISDKPNCNGIQCQLLNYVSKSMNFSFEFVYEAYETGHKLDNNS